MKRILFALSVALGLSACSTQNEPKIDLSGVWQFTTDSTQWNSTIKLSGSMTSNGLGNEIDVNTPWTGGIVDSSYFKSDEYAKYRQKGNVKIPFWLQPVKYYKGVAWYKREVTIPNDWDKKDIQLFLERAHWETRLWIDDNEIGMQNALSAPHTYDLTGMLSPGKHTITLRIDNRVKDIDPGENSHSISDHTQGNWNGVVGDMFLQARPLVNISDNKIYTDIHNKSITVKTTVRNRADADADVLLSLKSQGKTVEKKFTVKKDSSEIELTLPLGDEFKLWDEFNPNVYPLDISLKNVKTGETDIINETFGLRDIKVDGRVMSVNGNPVFLRGTLDCAASPNTGYPPTDKESWDRIMKICKSHGLNHIRFHSWCPPEAAFDAADEYGMYLEVECSSWANQSTTIGDGKPLDKFIYEESERIIKNFGNHPSLCMMKYGNEPAGEGSNKYLRSFVSYWKAKDNRHLYCSSSGWPNLEESDYLSDAAPRIQGWGQGLNSVINKEAPNTCYDWKEYIDKFNQPMVSHEIGQWCVYPDFKEIDKYKGVFRAKNFEIFKETLAEHGMANLADSFLLASGKLQTLCYKADIEAALRTKDMGGYQLLGLYDFPGQGTALVGVLNAFWDEKGYVTPQEFERFSGSVVPLARMKKMIYNNNESFSADIEVANYGEKQLAGCTAQWSLKNKNGEILKKGNLAATDIPLGNCNKIGNVSVPLKDINAASELIFEVSVDGHANSWNLWVYPSSSMSKPAQDIFMTDKMDAATQKALNDGKTVLLSLRKGSLSKNMGGDIQIGFSSIFWNTAWTSGQAPHTLGILCNPAHPALSMFPTDYYSNYQWWDAMSHSNAIEYAKLSGKLNPIVRVIDDWFTNRPLGLVFEMKVGKGKLLLTGIDFWNDMNNRLEARQLLMSLKEYAASSKFNPSCEVSTEILKTLF